MNSMPWLRALVRLARATMHLIKGVAIVALRFPGLDEPSRQKHVQAWSGQLVRLLGIRIEITGEPLAGRFLLVANHVSWLDIAVVHSCCPQARFVSKADVLRWPLVGRLVRGGGTLFIERERKRDALRVVHQVAQALSEGDCVALFPEGTTGEGHGLLPFHANLLQAAISAGVPVQAVVLRYRDPNHEVSPAVAYVGETTLLESMWRIAMANQISVQLDFLNPIASLGLERRELSQQLRSQMLACLPGPSTDAH